MRPACFFQMSLSRSEFVNSFSTQFPAQLGPRSRFLASCDQYSSILWVTVLYNLQKVVQVGSTTIGFSPSKPPEACTIKALAVKQNVLNVSRTIRFTLQLFKFWFQALMKCSLLTFKFPYSHDILRHVRFLSDFVNRAHTHTAPVQLDRLFIAARNRKQACYLEPEVRPWTNWPYTYSAL